MEKPVAKQPIQKIKSRKPTPKKVVWPKPSKPSYIGSGIGGWAIIDNEK